MEDENNKSKNEKFSQVIPQRRFLPLNVSLAIWALIELIFLSIPNLINHLAFFDAITFQGVHVRSFCTSGDPAMNARLLMSAWAISFLLTLYGVITLFRDKCFYSEFSYRSKIIMAKVFIGRYAPRRFKYYYIAALLAGEAWIYYYYMFAGHFEDTGCDTFLADRALFIQGGMSISGGYFLALILALFYHALRQRKNITASH